MFSVNVGTLDRWFRVGLGALLVATGLFCPYAKSFGMSAPVGLLVGGLVLVATGGLRFCPAYRLLGLSTCRVERPAEP